MLRRFKDRAVAAFGAAQHLVRVACFAVALTVGVCFSGQAFAQAPPAVELPDMGVSATDLIEAVTGEYTTYIGPVFGLMLAISLIWVVFRLVKSSVKQR